MVTDHVLQLTCLNDTSLSEIAKGEVDIVSFSLLLIDVKILCINVGSKRLMHRLGAEVRAGGKIGRMMTLFVLVLRILKIMSCPTF